MVDREHCTEDRERQNMLLVQYPLDFMDGASIIEFLQRRVSVALQEWVDLGACLVPKSTSSLDLPLLRGGAESCQADHQLAQSKCSHVGETVCRRRGLRQAWTLRPRELTSGAFCTQSWLPSTYSRVKGRR
jgi:hypothetical protein